MLFGDFFKDSIFVDAARHPAMDELAARVPRRRRMALHGLSTLPFWLALAGVVVACVFYIVKPGDPGGDPARASASSTACSRTSTTWTGSTRTCWRRRRAASGTGLWKGGDVGADRRRLINGSARAVGGLARGRAPAADRLPLLVRAGDDPRRLRPDDLAAVALPVGPGRPLTDAAAAENKNMGLLSLAIWLPIAAGVAAAGARPRRAGRRGALGRAGRARSPASSSRCR